MGYLNFKITDKEGKELGMLIKADYMHVKATKEYKTKILNNLSKWVEWQKEIIN